MANINISRLELPGKVYGGNGRNPIRQDQFLAEFEVTVDLNGCYAIDVRLVEDDDQIISVGLNRDEVIAAHTRATYPCYCFTQGQGRLFSITTTAPPLGNGQPLMPNPRAVTLDNLEGYWPQSDTGSELEVRLEVSVYLCRPARCETDNQCTVTPARIVKEQTPRVEGKSTEQDIDLLDGPEPGEVIGPLILEGGKAAVGQLRSAQPSIDATQFLVMADEITRLKRQVKRIQAQRNDFSLVVGRLEDG